MIPNWEIQLKKGKKLEVYSSNQIITLLLQILYSGLHACVSIFREKNRPCGLNPVTYIDDVLVS